VQVAEYKLVSSAHFDASHSDLGIGYWEAKLANYLTSAPDCEYSGAIEPIQYELHMQVLDYYDLSNVIM